MFEKKSQCLLVGVISYRVGENTSGNQKKTLYVSYGKKEEVETIVPENLVKAS